MRDGRGKEPAPLGRCSAQEATTPAGEQGESHSRWGPLQSRGKGRRGANGEQPIRTESKIMKQRREWPRKALEMWWSFNSSFSAFFCQRKMGLWLVWFSHPGPDYHSLNPKHSLLGPHAFLEGNTSMSPSSWFSDSLAANSTEAWTQDILGWARHALLGELPNFSELVSHQSNEKDNHTRCIV